MTSTLSTALRYARQEIIGGRQNNEFESPNALRNRRQPANLSGRRMPFVKGVSHRLSVKVTGSAIRTLIKRKKHSRPSFLNRTTATGGAVRLLKLAKCFQIFSPEMAISQAL
jgi:hypothetical protein